MGNELTPTQVKDIPLHIVWPTEEKTLYTLIMTDPDAPSRLTPNYREWHHWLVVNIPGNEVGRGKVNKLQQMPKLIHSTCQCIHRHFQSILVLGRLKVRDYIATYF